MSRNLSYFEKPPKLEIVDPARFKSTYKTLFDNENTFFGAARLQLPLLGGYFQVFSRALKKVPFTDVEEKVYSKWPAKDYPAAIELGWNSPKLSAGQLQQLAEESDPAIFIIATLEEFRTVNHPDAINDVKIREAVFASYALFAAGVHCERVFEA
jgi:hypothetical protein